MIRWLILALVLITPAAAGAERERIIHFHSDVAVQADGGLVVTETIRVYAGRDEIRRGIYRDFPTVYEGMKGTTTIGFRVLAVERDGKPESWHSEWRTNGKRIYFGREDHILPKGTYTYTFKYEVNRQLGFFEEHDELYWNVTGNDWAFAIDRATAKVTLPDGRVAHVEGYRGKRGSKDQGIASSIAADGSASFSAGRRLKPGEGLTIVAQWPKGIVAEPTGRQRLIWLLADNAILLFSAAGSIVLLIYYVFVWVRVGRDPAKGVIYPRFEPPAGVSPAAARVLAQMGYDRTCFTAALLSLGAQGALRIDESDGDYVLRRAAGPGPEASPGERAIYKKLLGTQDSITLKQSNHKAIGGAVKALKAKLIGEHQGAHFRRNRGYLIIGVLISIVTLALMAFTLRGDKAAGVLFLSVWLSFWTLGVSALLSKAYTAWRGVIAGKDRIANGIGAVFISLFAIPFLAAEVFAIVMLVAIATIWIVPALVALGLLHVVFHHLLKQPTLTGRKLMDEIEGLKMYLGTAESQRLARQTEPPRTLDRYEKLLPYAIALGVEAGWTDQFEDQIRQAQVDGDDGYRPTYYHGRGFTSGAALTSALGSSLASSVASASSAPGSSSGGGGGGSSGGGGGGGGGGGW